MKYDSIFMYCSFLFMAKIKRVVIGNETGARPTHIIMAFVFSLWFFCNYTELLLLELPVYVWLLDSNYNIQSLRNIMISPLFYGAQLWLVCMYLCIADEVQQQFIIIIGCTSFTGGVSMNSIFLLKIYCML